MNHRVKMGQTVYAVREGLTRVDGQIRTIRTGFTKMGGTVRFLPFPRTLRLIVSGKGDNTGLYLEANFADGSYRKISSAGTYQLDDVVSVYFGLSAGEGEILINGASVAEYLGNWADYTWTPWAGTARVEFFQEQPYEKPMIRRITVTTEEG